MSDRYDETLEYLYQQLPMFQRLGGPAIKKDLRNILELMRVLGYPHHSLPAIHIAGTNGKGSVTHLTAAIYQAQGFRVGCYTSPHYKDFRERIKINASFIPKDFVVNFVDQLKPEIEDIQPSFFELTVAMAFQYFHEEKVDIALIETGLGGRLDSTNVLTPLLSVITNIGYDHQEFLGDTLPEIAAEKAGIIKPKVPALIGEYQPEVWEVFQRKAEEQRSVLHKAEDILQINDWIQEGGKSQFTFQTNSKESKPVKVNSDVWGSYQKKNFRTAIATIELLQEKIQVSENAIVEGLSNVRSSTYFLGRCQVVSEKPAILFDSAHNVDGMRALLEQVDTLDFQNLHVVFAAVKDKKLDSVLDVLPSKARYYITRPDIPRALDEKDLEVLFRKEGFNAKSFPRSSDALAVARQAASDKDLILVCGSIFLVAELI